MDIEGFKERLGKIPKQKKRSPIQSLADEIFDYAKSIDMNVPYGMILGRIKARGVTWSRGNWKELKESTVTNCVKVFLAKDKDLFSKEVMDRVANNECTKCGTPMIKAYDNIAKKVTGYLFKPGCDCMPKDLRISSG